MFPNLFIGIPPMGPTEQSPEPASPTETTATEIVTADDTFALYEEVLAEANVTIRDSAKEVIRQRAAEIHSTRTLLARQEADMAKLLKKTPDEIALMADFNTYTQPKSRERGLLRGDY
jgi:hypothetical protein